MAERSSINRESQVDPSESAPHIPSEANAYETSASQIGETPASENKNPNAVALGRLGGRKGGKARAASLTATQRQDIARKAAQARWRKHREDRET